MVELNKNELPESAKYLGTDWQNNQFFDKTLDNAIQQYSGQVVYVKNKHYNNSGSYQQWSKDFYGI